MTTTLSIPPVASGDNVINSTNANNDLVEAAYGSIDGANIQSGTVPTTALMASKALFPVGFHIVDADPPPTAGAVFANIEFKVPNVDGGSTSNYKFIGYSVCAQTLTAPAGTIDIQKNGTTMLSAAIDMTALVAGTPTLGYPVSAVSLTSGDIVNIVPAITGSTAVSNLTIVLYFTLTLAST